MDQSKIPINEYSILSMLLVESIGNNNHIPKTFPVKIVFHREGEPLEGTIHGTLHGIETHVSMFLYEGNRYIDEVPFKDDKVLAVAGIDDTLLVGRYEYKTQYIEACDPLDSMPPPFFINWYYLSTALVPKLFGT